MPEETPIQETAQVATQTQPAPQPVKPPRKKKTGCLIIAVVLVFMLCCCGGVGLAAWPILSIYAGISDPVPEDLGITYTPAQIDSISQKTGITIDTAIGQPNAGTVMKYEGVKEVDTVLTQSEVSAYVNYVNSPNIPLSNVQIKLNPNQAVVSTLVTYGGHSYPVKATIVGTITGNTASGNIQIIKINGIVIPEQYRKMVTEAVLKLLNSRLRRVTGLNITVFKFKNNTLVIKGTFPAKAWREKELVK